MKRIGNLFDQIVSMDNLYQAYLNAKRGKGWYQEVKIIERRPYYYLAALKWELENGKFRTSDYQMFERKEGRKIREIYKLPFFPDRIAQWAIIQVIEPYLLASFVKNTYSAIPQRGIHSALDDIIRDIRNNPDDMQYCFKIDCFKFYPSIVHQVIEQRYRTKFKDRRLLQLIDEISESISTCPATQKNLKYYKSKGLQCSIIIRDKKQFIEGVGIPIGNYFSQYDGNFMLSGFDHYCKEILHVKYYRYMDDVCVFAATKQELHEAKDKIIKYIDEKLMIRVKDNWQIFPTYIRGLDFVGYRIFKGYVLLRKTTCLDMERKMAQLLTKCRSGKSMTYSEWCSFNSYKGWIKWCDGKRLSDKYIKPLQPYADKYYIDHIKKGDKIHD